MTSPRQPTRLLSAPHAVTAAGGGGGHTSRRSQISSATSRGGSKPGSRSASPLPRAFKLRGLDGMMIDVDDEHFQSKPPTPLVTPLGHGYASAYSHGVIVTTTVTATGGGGLQSPLSITPIASGSVTPIAGAAGIGIGIGIGIPIIDTNPTSGVESTDGIGAGIIPLSIPSPAAVAASISALNSPAGEEDDDQNDMEEVVVIDESHTRTATATTATGTATSMNSVAGRTADDGLMEASLVASSLPPITSAHNGVASGVGVGLGQMVSTHHNKISSSSTVNSRAMMIHEEQFGESAWRIYNPYDEWLRLGLHESPWRISDINRSYSFCASYPRLLVVAANISDQEYVLPPSCHVIY
jgi:hypothetical protein